MRVKNFIKMLNKLNPEAEISMGNFVYYKTSGYNIENIVNIDGDIFKFLVDDKKRDIKIIKKCVIWVSE